MTTAGVKLLPGADELFSEFQGYTGDCGEFAELSAVHIVAGLPLTPANLNLITRRDINHGWASANGGEPLISIANDLDALSLLYTLYNYPGPSNWQEILQSEAGVQPVIMELANGQNLAGDEPNLHYHFIAVVGRSSNGNYLCCDGDNVSRLIKLEELNEAVFLAEYTPTMIDGAQPCGMIIVRYPQNDPFGYKVEADGSIVYNASKIHLIGAIAQWVKVHNLQEECLYPETYFKGGEQSVTPFTNGIVLVWSNPDQTVIQNRAGEVITALLQEEKTESN